MDIIEEEDCTTVRLYPTDLSRGSAAELIMEGILDDNMYELGLCEFVITRNKTVKRARATEGILTIEKLKAMEPSSIFAEGLATDDAKGINMTNTGKELRWVACRGGIWDWAIYCHWSYFAIDYIHDHGDKVHNMETVKKLVPCDKDALQMYRH